MKIRSCFVSNSSSSSFIVVGNSLKKDKISMRPWKHGELEFSYGDWYDPDSKLNFLMLQRGYTDDYHMTEMLKEFCEKHHIDYDEYEKFITGCLESRFEDNAYPSAYIDHQSVVDEDDDMNMLFDNMDYLERFVLDDNSVLSMRRD